MFSQAAWSASNAPVRPLIVGSWVRYAPIPSVNVLRMNTVGPTRNRRSTRTTAAIALAFDRNCTPFSMPVTAENDEARGQDPDHQQRQRDALAGSFEHVVQPAGDLQSAETQRCGGTEQRREDRDHVDRLARRPPGGAPRPP